MPEHDDDLESKRQKFAERLRLGWQQLYPVTEQDLELGRKAVREEWDKKREQEFKAELAAQAERLANQPKPSLSKEGQEQQSDQDQDQHPPEQPPEQKPYPHY
jgi:hypothetical protein